MPGFTRTLFFRALTLGIATGLRSQIANGVLALEHEESPRKAGWRRWPVFRSNWGRKALIMSSAGEILVDKLPMAPSRLKPGPLAGRVAFGTLAGAALGTEGRGKGPVIRGAIFGTLGALIGNYGGYHARKAAVEATDLSDPAVAVAEDAIAITLATTAVRNR